MNDMIEWVKEHPAMTVILGLHAFFFVLLYSDPAAGEMLLVHPDELFARPFTLFTVMFSTGAILHLILNGFLIVMFGGRLEKAVSKLTAVGIFLVTGFAASMSLLVYAPMMSWTGDTLALSSAAAFGVTAAYAALRPDEEVVRSKAQRWVIILLIMNVVVSLQDPDLAMMAPGHTVGIVTGWLIGYGLKQILPASEEPITES
ncbi:rhomboid family intramembrane serine protease [Salisediminibacterium beveridgei]|uniref:Rhomboid family serine protease n=1 Tax=Salisediminibacterium beveridgei TaxID=632773 RepID=A0A1D7QZS3_9BACI|nr:rhomboid family intramembrane serine protease [Salisediminibacterium beveridgei]AOM84502.1 rhomboid family serine protease [Salisediminibacterium beveridgei]